MAAASNVRHVKMDAMSDDSITEIIDVLPPYERDPGPDLPAERRHLLVDRLPGSDEGIADGIVLWVVLAVGLAAAAYLGLAYLGVLPPLPFTWG